MADNIKLIVLTIIMIVAITLFYTYREYSTLLGVFGLLSAGVGALFIVSHTHVGSIMLDYLGATQIEVRKVVWPTRQETMQTTLIVILMVILMALLLWGIDSILAWAVRILTR